MPRSAHLAVDVLARVRIHRRRLHHALQPREVVDGTRGEARGRGGLRARSHQGHPVPSGVVEVVAQVHGLHRTAARAVVGVGLLGRQEREARGVVEVFDGRHGGVVCEVHGKLPVGKRKRRYRREYGAVSAIRSCRPSGSRGTGRPLRPHEVGRARSRCARHG